MAIACYEYYMIEYCGEPIAEAAFPRYAARAEEAIFVITRGADFCALPDAIKDIYRKAVCAQIEYYALQGIGVATEGGESSGKSYTIGKISVSGVGNSAKQGSAAYLAIAPKARDLLEMTGLLGRHVQTVSDGVWGWM